MYGTVPDAIIEALAVVGALALAGTIIGGMLAGIIRMVRRP